MDPSVVRTPNGYRIEFNDDPDLPAYLTLDCDNVESVGWGLISTVTVRTTITDARVVADSVLLIDRLNLQKPRERQDLARRISDLIPQAPSTVRMDWERHLEQAGIAIALQLRQAMPVTELKDRPLGDRQRFVIPGLLARGKANILYGPGGGGKSLVALRIGVSVSTGMDFMGMDVLYPGRVLYLDWEDDEDTITERLEHVCNGLRIPRVAMDYKSLRGRGPYERHHADVRFDVVSRGYELVIFDSTAMAMHGSSSGDGADGAIRFYGMLAELPTTSLLLDHISSDDVKAGSGTPKPYGSVFKLNSARNVWELLPWKKDALTGMTLRHRKTNVSRVMDDVDIKVDYEYDYVRFSHMDRVEQDILDELDMG